MPCVFLAVRRAMKREREEVDIALERILCGVVSSIESIRSEYCWSGDGGSVPSEDHSMHK